MIETGLQHRQVLRIIRMLFQIAHAQVAAISDFPLIIPFLSGQDIEQGGFSGTVLRYQTDALPFGHAERQILEKDQIAERFRQILYL